MTPKVYLLELSFCALYFSPDGEPPDAEAVRKVMLDEWQSVDPCDAFVSEAKRRALPVDWTPQDTVHGPEPISVKAAWERARLPELKPRRPEKKADGAD